VSYFTLRQLVFAPVGVSLLVGDQQAGVCIEERRRVRIVVLEPFLGVRGLQQAPPGRGVSGGKFGLQSHHALLKFFQRLDPAHGCHDQLHCEIGGNTAPSYSFDQRHRAPGGVSSWRSKGHRLGAEFRRQVT
jgi:hypothetical protein